MARAYWKGYLRLSLVTIGIELYTAVKSGHRPELHQIHEPTGKRVRYQKVAPGLGPVKKDEIVKGFEFDDDQYVLLQPEELDEIRLESKRTIDLVQFVEYCEIDPRYFAKPYYVLPKDEEVAVEGYTIIRDALRAAKKVALGQLAVRGRDYVVAIRPCGDGMLLETLRYADEIRESDAVFRDIPDLKSNKEMLELASELIDRKSAPFDAEQFKSQYIAALRELIEEKQKTGKISLASDEELQSPGNVVDLMAALKKSVAQKNQPSKKKSGKKSGKRAAG